MRCDIPVVRSDQTTSSFQLLWDQSKPLSLGGVLGGDQLSHFAMSLRFSTDGPLMQLSRGDIATWCRIDRAVIPFKPVGGELAVQLADTVITYPASRVTIGACHPSGLPAHFKELILEFPRLKGRPVHCRIEHSFDIQSESGSLIERRLQSLKLLHIVVSQ